MEEYLIYFGGAPCGSLRMERQGLYTHFSACCGARQGRLYSLVLEGERGEVPLGVPEWQDGCFVLKRTLANHAWSGIGVVQRPAYMCAARRKAGVRRRKRWWKRDGSSSGIRNIFSAHSRRSCPACRTATGNRRAGGPLSGRVPIEDGHPFLAAPLFLLCPHRTAVGKGLRRFYL